MVNQFVLIPGKHGHKKKLSFENKKNKFVTYYKYKLKYPHAGAGKRVQF